MKIVKISTFIILTFVSLALFSQDKKEFKKAKDEFKFENYRKSITHLETYLPTDSNNPEANYMMGVSLYLIGNREKALPFLEKAKSVETDYEDFVTFYAKSLHYCNKFEEAMVQYKKIREKTDPTKAEFMFWTQCIEQCKSGMKLIQNPVNVEIKDIGFAINSVYPDFAPVINADETMMFFTSRRKGNLGTEAEDGLFYEDIYFSEFKDGKWQDAKDMGDVINTTSHDASIALSPDASKLFIFKDLNNGDIYECELKGTKWSAPKPLPKPINSKYWDGSVSISNDGKTLFFSSDRPGGFGDKDIYFSTLQKNKTWSEPENMGPYINTPYKDDAPFIHPDGKTLYFSSQGHSSMGGYDIFKSELKNDKWSRPQNLGYPINTADDDIYFVISASGRHGYYASSRAGGIGDKDIFKITFVQKPVDSVSTIVTKLDTVKNEPINVVVAPSLTMLKGVVLDDNTKKPIEAVVSIIDNEKGDTLFQVTSNSTSGKYLITLPSGKNYGIVVQANNFLFHSENINIVKKDGFDEIVKDISLKSIKKGEKIVLKNIFYDFNSANLRPESLFELDRLKLILDENPKLKIKINSHTDNVGSNEYNVTLSGKRAKSVVDYLVKIGIKQERLTFEGKGESMPIDTNNTEIGRQNNRRTDFEIIEN